MRSTPLSTTILATGLLAIGLLAAAPVSSSAQQDGRVPSDGDWSITLLLFNEDGGVNFGLFNMITDRANLGLEVDFDFSAAESDVTTQSGQGAVDGESDNWSVAIGPSLRWYGLRDSPVSPFLRTKVSVGWGGSSLELNDALQRERNDFTVQGSLAIGAEWYPIRWLGIAGHTGVVASRTWTDVLNNAARNDTELRSWNVRTFRSGVQLNLYFR